MRATTPADPPIFTRAALAVLIVASGLAPLATASYLPALPQAQASLGATPVSMQFTLTATIVGVALGQLVFGPLSDRTGRKGALLVGVALFVLAGAAIAVSPNVGWMIGWRFVQGIGAGAGMVLGRAVVADRAVGIAVAKLLGVMMAIGVVVPAVAPSGVRVRSARKSISIRAITYSSGFANPRVRRSQTVRASSSRPR